MTQYVDIVLNFVTVFCFVVTALFGAFGIYEQIMGPDDSKNLLKKLHIPLSYKQVLIIGFGCLILLIVLNILSAKVLGEL